MTPQLAFFVSLVAQGAPSNVFVEVGASDPCALEQRAPDAVRRMIPGFGIAGDRSSASLVMALRSVGSEVIIEIRSNEEGAVPLVRRIGLSQDNCGAVADAVALILDRYVRDLGYVSSDPDQVRTEPPPTETSTQTTATATAARSTKLTTLHLDASLLVQGESGSPVRPQFGGAVELRFLVDEIVFLGSLGAALPSAEAVTNPDQGAVGEIQASAWRAGAGVGLCFGLGADHGLCPSVLAGLEQIRAEGVGDEIFRKNTSTVSQLRLDARLAYDFLALDPLILSGWIFGVFRPNAPEFEIADATPTYSVPAVALAFGIGARVRIF